jgi:hypothetical protein
MYQDRSGLTVDNPTAARFKRFDGHLSEHVLRDAVEKTFRGAARGANALNREMEDVLAFQADV